MHFFLLPFLLMWFLPDIIDRFRYSRFGRSSSQYGYSNSRDEQDPFFGSFEKAKSERLYRKVDTKMSSAILQNRVFKLAKANGGRLTLSDAVIETNLSIKQAEQFMNALVDGTHVTADVDDTGLMVYLFPELVNDDQ